ncbi:MAG: alpha/beta fold hydrolase [Acidimicrobiia bacterium]
MVPLGSAPVDPEFVEVLGHRVRVEIFGTGPPLLLLNGLSLATTAWRPLAEAMAGRMLVAFDAPGVGASPLPPGPLSIMRLARVAAGVLDELDIESADVVGYSHGGAVAQQLAFDASGRVRRLVLACTSCGVGWSPGNLSLLARAMAWHRSPEGRDQRTGMIANMWQAWAYATWTSVPFLGGIRQPALVISGSSDRIVPAVNGRMLARRLANGRYVELAGDHDLFSRQWADTMAATIEYFLCQPETD